MKATTLAALCALALLAGCSHDQPKPEAPPQRLPNQVQNQPTPLELLRTNAERGDLEAQFQLGSHFFVAKPADLKQAEFWWKRAADKGHAMAAVSLAYLYTGRNDPAYANQQAMLQYLNQSAATGNPMAQHVLGSLYLKGEQGVPRDPDQARRLYQAACGQRYEASCAALKTLP